MGKEVIFQLVPAYHALSGNKVFFFFLQREAVIYPKNDSKNLCSNLKNM